MKRVLIVGAGKSGMSLLEHLAGKRDLTVKGVVDKDDNAPGVVRAKQLNIPAGTDILSFMPGGTDLVINTTGSKEIEDDLRKIFGTGTEIMSSTGSSLFSDLAAQTSRYRQRVRLQASILEQVRNAVIVAGIDGKISYMNPYAEKLYQWEAADAAGKHVFSLIVPEEGNAHAAELLSATLFEGYWEGEIVARKKDGTIFPAYLTNSVIRGANGIPAGLISVSYDTSELRKAEDALKTQLNVRRAMESAVLPGIVVYDTQGTHIYVNSGFCKIVGWSAEELVGMMPPFVYWPEEAREYNRTALESVLEGKTGAGMIELTFCRRSGERFNALMLTAPVYDEYAKLNGWVSSISDITEYKRKEEQLSNSREQLRNLTYHIEEEREAERADIAHRVHDEIGQPLAALKLELFSLSKKLQESQKTLLERTDVMNRIIDKGIQAVKNICFDLRPWILDDMGITEAIRWNTEEFERLTGIRCELFIDPAEFRLSSDLSTTIFRIYQELLRNIERHAGATKVSIGFFLKSDKIILEVKDNGVGIPENRIYDSGSFGLVSIREKVIAWNGDVEIRGEDKIGTEVRVIFPLK